MRTHPNIVLRGDHNECPSCGHLFNSSHSFEKHRIGDFGKDRRCATEGEMIAKGMSVSAGGWWISSARENASCGLPCDLRSDQL